MGERRTPEHYRRMEIYLRRLQRLGIKFGLETITRILKALGNPQRNYPSILIGGTNGKGSVAAILAAIFERAGIHTGLYTSPHLVKLEERFVVGGRPIPGEDLAENILKVRDTTQSLLKSGSLKHSPTYFEVTTAAALSYFADQRISMAILEVGMGGRFDATNAVEPILSIVTPVEIDHQEFLGDTLAAIAGEKLGIVRPGGVLVTGRQHPEVEAVIEKFCRDNGVTLREALRSIRVVRDPEGAVSFLGKLVSIPPLRPALCGEHQLDNAATALAACQVMSGRGFPIPDAAIAEGLQSVEWPGRLQSLPGRPRWLLDGAHNPAACRALSGYLQVGESTHPPVLVFGALEDKDHEGMLRALTPNCSEVVLCRPPTDRAASREALLRSGRRVGIQVAWKDAPAEALALAAEKAGPAGTILVTGSLYLVGEALRLRKPAAKNRKTFHSSGSFLQI